MPFWGKPKPTNSDTGVGKIALDSSKITYLSLVPTVQTSYSIKFESKVSCISNNQIYSRNIEKYLKAFDHISFEIQPK